MKTACVTIAIVSTDAPDVARSVLRHCGAMLPFGAELLLRPETVSSVRDYNAYTLSELAYHVGTSHALTIQPDGFIINPFLWDDAWLDYDYIGAPWPRGAWHSAKSVVGNSGFCLRSKRLLTATSRLFYEVPLGMADDVATCYLLYDALLSLGMRFAPMEVASLFSFEQPTQYGFCDESKSFGFHGTLTESTARRVFNARNGVFV